MQETLLRAWRHPEVTDDSERSARAWLFTVARNLIIDERRSARFRSESGTPDMEQAADHAGPDEVETALDRMLLGEAMAQLSEDHRAVISRAYYQGWTTAQIAADLQIAEGTVKSRLHYGDAGAEAQVAGNGGDTVTQFGLPNEAVSRWTTIAT